MKRTAAAILAVLLLCLCASAGAEKVITLSFTGDCTLGCEEEMRYSQDCFDQVVLRNGYDYCFANFIDLFSQDDCTVVNCESVFQDTRDGEKTSKSFRFRGRDEFVNIFKEGSVEAVSLSNNHTMDYSTAGFNNTKKVLEEAGIGWAWEDVIWVFEKDGIHRGTEYAPKHIQDQDTYAEYFINQAKVDLVIMHHPHVLQGIRILNNRNIFYSLGNFVFGGYYKVTRGEKTGTNSLYTMAVQVKMYFTDEGEYKGQQAYIYPAYDSGTDPLNNYQPVRVSAEEAIPIVAAIQYDTEWPLPEIQEDETGKAIVVLDYLPDEEAATGTADPESGKPEPASARPAR